VCEGQAVQASDTVAQALLPGELQIVRLAEEMGIEPFEVEKGLKVTAGQEVQPGTVLCEHKGLFRLFTSRHKASVSGTVEMLGSHTGHLGIRLPARPISVNAYISGRVVRVEPKKSVLIESRAAFVQGIFGVGGERHGCLRMLKIPGGKRLEPADLDGDLCGLILVGGTKPSIETLRRATELGAVGMIVGSLDDQALAAYLGYDLGIALTGDEDIPMTLIATEGFGELPISERVLALLAKFDGLRASINGATQVRAGALRPEVIIAHGDPAADDAFGGLESGLQVGSGIRLIRVPYFGLRGKVVELPNEVRKIETGASARILVAQLEDGRRAVVPRANVELV
jgi:hypothetical protein